MRFFNILDINIISFIYTIGILLISFYNNKHTNRSLKIFSMVILCVSLNLLLETISLGIQTHLIFKSKILLQIILFVYYLLSILIHPGIYILIYSFIKADRRPSTLENIFLFIPTILNTLLLLFNLSTGWLYSVDNTLKYTRGELFTLYSGLIAYYTLLELWLLLTNIKRYRQKHIVSRLEFLILTAVVIIPAVGALLQYMFYGIYVTLPVLGFVLSTSYHFLKGELNTKDTLTNAWSRSGFEKYLDSSNIKHYSIALFNIDELGKINEKFGYTEGDSLLSDFANMLKDIAPHDASVIRYGPDLFIVFYPSSPMEKIKEDLEKIQNAVDKYNSKNNKYTLEYTKSFGTFNPKIHKTLSYLVSSVNDEILAKKLSKKLENLVYSKMNG